MGILLQNLQENQNPRKQGRSIKHERYELCQVSDRTINGRSLSKFVNEVVISKNKIEQKYATEILSKNYGV